MKELLLDMDGTIANLYEFENWLDYLTNSDVTPYVHCKPMYDMEVFNTLLTALKRCGYKIKIATHLSRGGTKKYNTKVAEAKKQWLRRFGVPYDKFYAMEYGTPKAQCAESSKAILVDDNAEVRELFLKSNQERRVIDATKNLLIELTNLLMEG